MICTTFCFIKNGMTFTITNNYISRKQAILTNLYDTIKIYNRKETILKRTPISKINRIIFIIQYYVSTS